MQPTIKTILKLKANPVTICGWIRSVRAQKSVTFITLDDGTGSIQAVISHSHSHSVEGHSLGGVDARYPVKDLTGLHPGAAVQLTGSLTSQNNINSQSIELAVDSLRVLGRVSSPLEYPLHKRVSLDHLRNHLEFRSRSNTFSAIWRLRSALLSSIQGHLKSREFIQTTTPILTSHDCEGGGQVFELASQKFFGKPVYTTVSGQLHLEVLASAMARVYTLGPTFRAEPSDSTRHLAEFWMMEAEIAFMESLESQLIPFIQEMLQCVVKEVLNEHSQDLEFLDEFIEPGLIAKLKRFVDTPFSVLTYTEAIQVLSSKGYSLKWGQSLSSEHEKRLAQDFGPLFITHYPKSLKPFYMKPSSISNMDSNDRDTVACLDLVLPGWGEIIGGSLREDDPEQLRLKMAEHGLNEDELGWYSRLRDYGSTPHGGFGLGIERLLGFVTGIKNVRDLIPFPRAKGLCRA